MASERVRAVRNGQTHATVVDPLLLPMLANDPDCVENLVSIFFSVDFTAEAAADVAKFKNLKKITFYGGNGVPNAVAGAAQLPVETIGFDSATVDEDLLRQLARFPHLKEVQLMEDLDPKRRKAFESLLPGVRVLTPSSAPPEQPQAVPAEAE